MFGRVDFREDEKKKEKKFFFEECLVGRGRGKRDGVWEFSPRVLQKFFSPKWGENVQVHMDKNAYVHLHMG